MAYLAVNKDGKEVRFDGARRPLRVKNKCIWAQLIIRRDCTYVTCGFTVPNGTITALTGQKLTFDDEPIKI